MMDSHIFPFFMLAQTAIAAGMWVMTVHMAKSDGAVTTETPWMESLGGLELFYPGKTDLRLNDDCTDYRFEVWRWILYQFSHVGINHIGANSVLNLVMGIPLEKLHGSWRACLMYNVGVVGGALCYMVGDGRNSTVGMSGGCYSLIGVHLAYTIINWHQRKYRKVVLLILFIFAASDTLLTLGFGQSDGHTKPSNSAHLGGAVAGLIMGVVLGKNLQVKCWERVLKWSMLATGIGLVAFCLCWVVVWPPMNVWEPVRWCWTRQVYNATLFPVGQKQHWRCVRCGDQTCIDYWSKQTWTASATLDQCANDIGWYDPK